MKSHEQSRHYGMNAENYFKSILNKFGIESEFVDSWFDFLVNKKYKVEVKSCQLSVKDGTSDRRYFPNHVRKKKRKQIILHGLCQCESCKRYRKKNGGSLVYMDPPYHKTGKLYDKKQWKDVDFVRLRNSFHELSISGHSVILSMSDTPFIRELFKGYNIKQIDSMRSMNHKKVKELVITNILDNRLKKLIRKNAN